VSQYIHRTIQCITIFTTTLFIVFACIRLSCLICLHCHRFSGIFRTSYCRSSYCRNLNFHTSCDLILSHLVLSHPILSQHMYFHTSCDLILKQLVLLHTILSHLVLSKSVFRVTSLRIVRPLIVSPRSSR